MGKRELILEAFHNMFHFYLWTAFKVLVVRKKKKACKQQICWNSWIVISHEELQKHDVSTHAWPW